ncbi:MAG: TM2 domain-containing protein, partial [Paramuribaculum sp.]|nr:TM2 domain-containing protein [Paramuribaculum sp.]
MNQNNNCNTGNGSAFDAGPSGRSRGVAGLLAIFLGSLGIQYFYLGKTQAGIIAIVL